MFRSVAIVAALLWSMLAAPLCAQVALSVHSREMGNTFPHAFVTFEGTLSDGTPVPLTGVGFTARRLSPAILMGSVEGEVEAITGRDLTRGTNHFTVMLDDAAYARMLAVIADWRGRAGRSYNLERANCIHFVMDIARSVGLATNPATRFHKRPRAFSEELKALNPTLALPPVPVSAADAG